jgi:hypothetical protein
MKILKLIAVPVILFAGAIPFFPAPRNASAYARHFRELAEWKGSETMVVVCTVGSAGVKMCDLETKEKAKQLLMPECIIETARDVMSAPVGKSCRFPDGNDYATPTREQLSNIAYMAKDVAWKIQRPYYTAAAAVAVLGFALLLVGLRSGRRPAVSERDLVSQEPPTA